MRMEKTSRLTDAQKAEIRELEAAVRQGKGWQDAVFLDNELNFDRSAPCFYLGYEGKKLVSFLTVFFPDREEGEITAFTHPEFRCRGCFSALCREAVGDMKALGVGRPVACLDAGSESGRAALSSLPGASFLRSEQRMERRDPDAPLLREGLRVEPLSQENRMEYAAVKNYPDQPGAGGETDGFVDAVLSSKTRRGYILYDGGRPVGVFDLEAEPGRIFLYGVEVALSERGRGYGREIVRSALREGAASGKPVVLDVDLENAPALHLYESCGFRPRFRMDYYAFSYGGPELL